MDHLGEPNLQDWAANARVDEAARRRRRLTSWNQHGCEDATFEGVLADLMDRRCQVLLTLANGRRHSGRVVALSGGWSIVGTSGDRTIGVRMRAILGIDCAELLRSFGDRAHYGLGSNPSIRPTPALGGPSPDATSDATTRVLIESIIDPGEQLTMWSGTLMTSGELRSLSQDLAVVVSATGVRYVPLAGVDEVIGSRRA